MFSITNSTLKTHWILLKCFLLLFFSVSLSVIIIDKSSRNQWKQKNKTDTNTYIFLREKSLWLQNQIVVSHIAMTVQWKIKTLLTHHLKLTVNKATAKSRLLKINKCVKKCRTLSFTLKLRSPSSLWRNSSATIDAQVMLRKDTGRETIWTIFTDCCWTTIAYNWIMNWGADSRAASARTANLHAFRSSL